MLTNKDVDRKGDIIRFHWLLRKKCANESRGQFNVTQTEHLLNDQSPKCRNLFTGQFLKVVIHLAKRMVTNPLNFLQDTGSDA